MNMKKRIIILVISLIIITGVIIGVSYAFFSTGGSQETANTFKSGCLNITLADASSSISLTNTYPITDIEGLNTTSYDFTITNTCSTSANYEINLESLNEVTNSLSADYIKVSLSSDTVGNVISILSSNTSTTTNIDNAYEAYNLYTGVLNASETKTYHLKLWIDYDATVEQAANKVYQSKINVIANPDIQVVDNLETTFTLSDKTLTANLTSNVTSATYCTTTSNICEPSTSATVSSNSYAIELQSNKNKQMVCTKLNGTSKVICSDTFEIIPTAKDTILANYPTVLTRSDFSTTVTSTTTGTIYKSLDSSQYDDDGEVYYFAGAPTDNWVYFAGFYWRIIRINGDGTIRIIYNGTSTTTTGTGTQLSSTSAFNTSFDDNMYVGFKYTSGEVHGMGTNSTILDALNTWYSSNLSSYASYIDTNAGFCNDRYPSTSNSSSDGSGGTGTIVTHYAASIRLVTNEAPSFKCQTSSDLFTVSGSSKGNKALTYPIGLITADEVAYAGGVNLTNNSSYYLYTGEDYWTMSPYSYSLVMHYGYAARLFYVSDRLINWFANTTYGVRPVINLRADITLSGSGTTSSPYTVS